MTDRQAKRLALSIVEAWESPIPVFVDQANAISLAYAERVEQELRDMLFKAVGIPERFLVLDSVTTADEVRVIERAKGYRNNMAFGLILDGSYTPPLVSPG